MSFEKFLCLLNGILLMSPTSWAQNTFGYGRNDLIPVEPMRTSSLRPLAETFPSISTGKTIYPTTVPGLSVATGPTGPTVPTGGLTSSENTFTSFPVTAQAPRPTLPTTIDKRPISGLGSRPPTKIAFPGLEPNTIYGSNLSRFPSIGRDRDQVINKVATSSAATSFDKSDYDGDYSAIPGVPGVNYPVYSQVPITNFDCSQQALPGYYADVEAQCQAFHICALNRTYSFLCPNGTIFNQAVLVCVWWNQYDCATAPSLYANNAFIYDYGLEGVPPSTAYRETKLPQAQSPVLSNAIGNVGRASNPPANVFGGRSNIPAIGNIVVPSRAFSSTMPTNTGRFDLSQVNRAGTQPIPPITSLTPFGNNTPRLNEQQTSPLSGGTSYVKSDRNSISGDSTVEASYKNALRTSSNTKVYSTSRGNQ